MLSPGCETLNRRAFSREIMGEVIANVELMYMKMCCELQGVTSARKPLGSDVGGIT